MKCPYCKKQVKDIEIHFNKSPQCVAKHKEKLLNDLEIILINNQKSS